MIDDARRERDLKLRGLDVGIEHLRTETATALREMRHPPVVVALIPPGRPPSISTPLSLAD